MKRYVAHSALRGEGCANSRNTGRSLPNSGQTGPVDLAQIWPTLGRFRPSLGKMLSTSVQLGPESTKFGANCRFGGSLVQAGCLLGGPCRGRTAPSRGESTDSLSSGSLALATLETCPHKHQQSCSNNVGTLSEWPPQMLLWRMIISWRAVVELVIAICASPPNTFIVAVRSRHIVESRDSGARGRICMVPIGWQPCR